MTEEHSQRKISPSDFMRQLRPSLYSDSEGRTVYVLDAAMLEYRLETVTARNETHEFEIFCRKICERKICPNLKPATGSEGGGDSKADTETVPVADEISILSYVGEANAGQERWAFAFSANKKWAEKVRKDVAGIVATHRDYQKIFCITAQFARAKDRAQLEDDLSEQFGLPVTVLDRSWIVEQVVAGDSKDLAFNYLNVGQETKDQHRLGPADYSRTQQLEDIERAIADPRGFSGMEMQRVTEALLAAKHSRSLERPRVETDGRFARAVRLAERDGSYRQKLEANYESIWTAFWWFDDVEYLTSHYDVFEQSVVHSDHAKNLELLCNLAQLLFNSVMHGHLTPDEAKIDDRVRRLAKSLEAMAADTDRPNNALEARTSLLVIKVNQAALAGNAKEIASLWAQFSKVVSDARGLGEYSADRLTKMIEVLGDVAGNNPDYAKLVDDVAAFVTERTGEAQGALVLLKRAQQLNFDDNFEMIRLLGKAARQLTKKEHVDSLVEALHLLSLAYRSAGLLWAARATCIFALAALFIEAEEGSELPPVVVPNVMMLAWIAIELRHFPDALEAIRLVRGCAAGLPLDDASKANLEDRLSDFDYAMSVQVLNLTEEELVATEFLPDVLDRLGLHLSRTALVYALGHEEMLREEGSIPAEDSAEKISDLFSKVANQLEIGDTLGGAIYNGDGSQCLVSGVQGIRMMVYHRTSDTSILAAEAVIGAIEALFATTMDIHAVAHTESFAVTIEDVSKDLKPDFKVDPDNMTAVVYWPLGLHPGAHNRQDDVQRMLLGLIGTIFAATCTSKDIEADFHRLLDEEAVLDRLAMIASAGSSRQRIFKEPVSRLADWARYSGTDFPLKEERPIFLKRKLEKAGDPDVPSGKKSAWPNDHREMGVRSLIDVHLWNRAVWRGAAYADWGPKLPPVLSLIFTDEEAARKIFSRWRDRLGQTDKEDEIYIAIVRAISVEHPAHYKLLVSSKIRSDKDGSSKKVFSIASRIHTLEAESDINLTRFLKTFSTAGAYLLMPSIINGTAQPKFLRELAILKRELSVKTAAEVKQNDLEVMALGEEEYRARFGADNAGPGS